MNIHKETSNKSRTVRWKPWGSVVLLFGMFLLLEACKHEPQIGPLDPLGNGNGNGGEDPCDPDVVYFQQQVLPILISNCAVPGCHNIPTDDNNDIHIISYGSLMGSDIVQDGDFWDVITDNDPDDRMPPPPQNPLTQSQIALIGQWLQQGAQNTSCESGACDTLNVTYSGSIVPLIQQRCQGCHSGGSPQAGLNFTNYATLNSIAMDGRLEAVITHDPLFAPMPPTGGMLPPCEIRKFLIWADAGAPNN